MANKRRKPEEIVTKLRQVDVLVGQGMARIDAIRRVRIVEQTYYRWRKQCGGMGPIAQRFSALAISGSSASPELRRLCLWQRTFDG